ncbi:antitoxin VbhA family protein [Dyella lutea]|nr:antitoxin VbhA family protein [Dyella lutea]
MPTHPKITPEERARRQEYADGARANVGLEGFKPSAAMEGRVLLYIEGEITLAELVDPANDAPH